MDSIWAEFIGILIINDSIKMKTNFKPMQFPATKKYHRSPKTASEFPMNFRFLVKFGDESH